MTALSTRMVLATVAVIVVSAAGIWAAGAGPVSEPAPVPAGPKPVEPAKGPARPNHGPLFAAHAGDKDAFGDPLPEGAACRLGTVRGGPRTIVGGAQLLAPTFGSFFVGDYTRAYLHEVATGKVTELAGQPRGGINSVLTASADGRRVVAIQYGSLLVLDAATGKVVYTADEQYTGDVQTVSLSADGKRFACTVRPRAGKDDPFQVAVWDVDQGAEVARVPVLLNQIVCAVLSPDGKTLATSGKHNPGDGQTVQVWDVATRKELAILVGDAQDDGAGGAMAFSPDGKTLATSSGRGAIALWELPGGKRKDTLLGRSAQGWRLAFSPDGKTLAAIDLGCAVDRWSLPDGKALPRTECPVPPTRSRNRFGYSVMTPGLAFVNNDRAVVWGVVLNRWVAWAVPGGELLTPVSGHLTEIQAVRFAANGREVISVGADNRTVRWDPATGKPNVLPPLDFDHRSYPSRLAPGGARGLCDGRVFDTATGAEEFRLPGDFAFPSPDFTRALTVTTRRGPNTGTTPGAVWNLETRKKVAALDLPYLDFHGVPGNVAVAFSPDNSRLVTAITVYNTAPGKDSFVVTGWSAKTGKKLGEFVETTVGARRWNAAAAGNNSGAVLTTDDGKLWVADYEKGARADTIDEGPRGLSFQCPTFGPDGTVFAAGVATAKPDEFGVRVYAWPSGKILHTFVGHSQEITALDFSADGTALASGSGDGTILVWDLKAIDKPK